MRWVFLVGAAAVAFAAPGVAEAAPPANDAFVAATAIASLPASDTVDLTEATLEGGEPSGGCWPQSRTAWYVIQPSADVVVRITTSGFFDRVVNLYRDNGSGIGGLGFMGCAYPWSEIVGSLRGGATYYVQVGAPTWSGAGNAMVQLSAIDPPVNDDFANAKTAGSLPYSDTVDMRAATVESGEPTQPAGVFQSFTGTSWYAFTPSQSGSLMVTRIGCCANGHNVAIYTGGAVDALTPVAALRPWEGRAIFAASAGTTYMIQNGLNGFPYGSALGIQLQQTPLPSVSSFSYPYDPSIYDTINFSSSAYDPAGVGIESFAWDFGDGSGATDPYASHRYAADGDYSVTLTVTTPDGRVGTATRVVGVRTHDVAIDKMGAPQTARVDQTRTITVGLVNRRDAESVTVTLYRSRPGGSWDVVGQSTQLISPRTGNRTTTYLFSYTFTPDDASIGKVTFRATATINGARDALPADNEAITPPTAVSA